MTIPEGVASIGECAFSGCDRLDQVDLPRSIREIWVVSYQLMAEKVYKLMPEGVLQTVDKLNPELTALIDKVWCEQLTPKDWAGLYIFQTAKEFQELCKNHMKNVPADECLSAMLELLADCKKGSAYVQAANFVVEHLKEVSSEHIQTLYEMAAAKKSFQKAADILKPLVSAKKKKAAKPDGTFAFLEDAFQEEQLLKHYKEHKGVLARLNKVLLADSSGQKAPKLVVLAAVMPYAEQYQRPAHISTYKTDYIQVNFVKEADRAAELLDRESPAGPAGPAAQAPRFLVHPLLPLRRRQTHRLPEQPDAGLGQLVHAWLDGPEQHYHGAGCDAAQRHPGDYAVSGQSQNPERYGFG